MDITVSTKIALKSVSQQLWWTNGNGATVPLTSTATGTRPFLAPLPAPGAQGPAQLTTQWAGRMRGTAGHPEIAPLVRNQKGNQKESGRGGEDGSPEDGNPGSKGEERGGDGWLVGVRMCVRGTGIVCMWQYCAVQINVLFPCKNTRTLAHMHTE